jgi:CubicO group peptidase (beta-lactamase class C family)
MDHPVVSRCRRAAALAVLLTALSTAVPAAAENPHLAERLKAVEALLQKRFPPDQPGAAVVLIADGKVALLKGYGLADLDTKRPISPQTAFDLASVSKQFTAMAVMILADRGKLAFDDDVRKYLPELPEFDAKRPIRVNDLLRHTSGLPDYLGIWKGSDEEFARLTNEDVLALLAKRKLLFPTGSKHEYSNSNYALLPVIVTRVAGKPFGKFVAEEIFRPLDMRHSLVFDAMGIQVPDRVTGYRPDGSGKWLKSVRDGPTCGDGNVFTTAEDLVRWDAALAASKLVKPETLRLAFTPGKTDDGKEFGYGLGWAVARRNGKLIVEHAGGWAGTSTFIHRAVDDKVTVIVLCNDQLARAGPVGNQILKAFQPAPAKEP